MCFLPSHFWQILEQSSLKPHELAVGIFPVFRQQMFSELGCTESWEHAAVDGRPLWSKPSSGGNQLSPVTVIRRGAALCETQGSSKKESLWEIPFFQHFGFCLCSWNILSRLKSIIHSLVQGPPPVWEINEDSLPQNWRRFELCLFALFLKGGNGKILSNLYVLVTLLMFALTW